MKEKPAFTASPCYKKDSLSKRRGDIENKGQMPEGRPRQERGCGGDSIGSIIHTEWLFCLEA
jgi:hypothetical protein